MKLKDLPKKLVNFLTFLAFLAFLALIATGPLLLSSCENTFKDAMGEKREIAPLEVVERNGYSVSKDHYNREFAMVPKGSPIPEEVLKKYGPESIVRTPPEKIIVASGTYDPGVIFALGKGDTIIGTTEPYETWALPEMKELYEKNRVKFIGFHNAIDFESLITLKPDLVLTSGMTVARDVMYYGFPVLITYSSLNHNLESKIKYFPFMGKILNAEDIANERVTKIRNTLKEIEEKTRYLPKPKVTWGLYYNKQVITLSGDIWIAELIKISGGDYVFADNRVGANAFSLEEFITKSKDADIFFANPLLETVAKQQEAMAKSHVGLKELKAFSDKGMVVVAEPILFQDSGHIEEIALDMAALFHPELYPDRKLKYIKILDDINDLPF